MGKDCDVRKEASGTEPLRLQRHLDSPSTMDPGQWTKSTDPIQLSCPLCDRLALIGSDYDVDAAGAVTPIWTCPACPFRDWIALADFEEVT